MSADNLRGHIAALELEVTTPPRWLSLLTQLNRTDFSPDVNAEDIVRLDEPRTLRDKMENSLRGMGVTDHKQILKVFRCFAYLSNPRVGGKPISDKPLTLREIREIGTPFLAKIDGFDEKGAFRVAIVHSLLGD